MRVILKSSFSATFASHPTFGFKSIFKKGTKK